MDETARTIAVASIILAALSLAVSGLSLGLSWWIAHRDNPDVRLDASIGTVTSALLLASPQVTLWDVTGQALFTIDVINRGRRPVTINVAGFIYRTTGVWRLIFWEWDRRRPDRSVWVTTNSQLPARMDEQSHVTFFSTLAGLRQDLQATLKSGHQIRGVFADDVTGRRYTAQLPRKLWQSLTKDLKFTGGTR